MFGWFKSARPTELDLRQDQAAFVAAIATAVREYSKSSRSRGSKPATRIDLKFDLTSEAFPRVWVELDVEPSGEPQTGRTTPVPIFERVCKHWARPCRAALEGKPVNVVTPRGTKTVNSETSLCEAVGEFFVDLIGSLRSRQVFQNLPRAAHCYLGVRTEDGEFWWPNHETQGRENMV